jgi:hypothetical protein
MAIICVLSTGRVLGVEIIKGEGGGGGEGEEGEIIDLFWAERIGVVQKGGSASAEEGKGGEGRGG